MDSEELQIKNIRDMVFMHDYNEPTLAILYEPRQTWAGDLSTLSASCCIAIASINLELKTISVIHKISDIPQDTFKLIPLTRPIGGLIAISSTSIMHFSQNLMTFMNITSNLAKIGAGKLINEWLETNHQPYSDLNLVLDGSHAELIGSNLILLWNMLGEFISIEVIGDVRGVNKINIDSLARNKSSNDTSREWVIDVDPAFVLSPSTVSIISKDAYGITFNSDDIDSDRNVIVDHTRLNPNKFMVLFFVGTRGGHSILSSINLESEKSNDNNNNGFLTKNETENSMDIDDMLYSVNETFSFQPTSISPNSSSDMGLNFKVHDKLICAAPLFQIDIGESSFNKSGLTGEDNLELTGSIGVGPQGGIVVMQKYVRPSVLASYDIGFSQSRLRDGASASKFSPRFIWNIKNGESNSNLIMGLNSSARSDPINQNLTNSGLQEFVVITSEFHTTVLRASGELSEVIISDFVLDKPTLCVGQLSNLGGLKKIPVQICSDLIIIFNSDLTALHKVVLTEDDYFIQADIMGSYIVTKMLSGKAKLFKFIWDSRTLKEINFPSLPEPTFLVSIYTDHFYKVSKQFGSDLHEEEESHITEENISTLGSITEKVLSFENNFQKNPDYWLVTVDSLYTMRIYLLPKNQLIWTSDRLDLMSDLILNSKKSNDPMDIVPEEPLVYSDEKEKKDLSSIKFKYNSIKAEKKINHMRIVNLGENLSDIYLVILTAASEVIIYKSFHDMFGNYTQSIKDNFFFELKFHRIPSGLFTYYPDYSSTARKIRGWDVSQEKIPSPENSPTDEIKDTNDDTEINKDDDNSTIPVDDLKKQETNDSDKDYSTTFGFKIFEYNSLIHFSNIGGYSGLFILGAVPLWLLVGKRNFPRLHPMRLVPMRNSSVSRSTSGEEAMENYVRSAILSSITGWAPLNGNIKTFDQKGNQVNNKSLFVATTWSGTLVIGSLPTLSVDYDNPWPTVFMQAGNFSGVGSLESIAYHSSTKNYVVVTTKLDNFYLKENYSINSNTGTENIDNMMNAKDAVQQQQNNELALIPEQKRPDLATTNLPPVNKRSVLELLSPITFETIDMFELEPNEIVTNIKSLMLESLQTNSGKKNFLVVGTTFVLGEDILTRGHILIFDIISIVPDPNNPERTKKLKRIYKEEMRGGVSSIESLQNHYLIVAVGNKLFIRSFRDNENLVSVAFLDCQIYVKSIATIKSYFLVADFYNSIWFAGFQDEPSKIVVLGRDSNCIQVAHADFLVHNKSMAILAADIYGNVYTFAYDPSSKYFMILE
ncbi:Cleavage and polyadenylation specificity factor subunit 1 [Smittium mucronatum]|uniref:Cleavage and polyadenylation specificity factor subunit 1 n=1 Tax=Smittium mucronatum TaxID=133383 RepID=A0A1R0GZB3_9FUNG|nr:Cleavage and polyadenylation specificity factor subunit 1 [Smittium mucronatum]